MLNTVDGCEILHQLIGSKHSTIEKGFQPSKVVQDFTTIHSMWNSSSDLYLPGSMLIYQRVNHVTLW